MAFTNFVRIGGTSGFHYAVVDDDGVEETEVWGVRESLGHPGWCQRRRQPAGTAVKAVAAEMAAEQAALVEQWHEATAEAQVAISACPADVEAELIAAGRREGRRVAFESRRRIGDVGAVVAVFRHFSLGESAEEVAAHRLGLRLEYLQSLAE